MVVAIKQTGIRRSGAEAKSGQFSQRFVVIVVVRGPRSRQRRGVQSGCDRDPEWFSGTFGSFLLSQIAVLS